MNEENMKLPKLNNPKIDKLKDGGRKILVDCASVAIFLVVVNSLLSGFGTIYSAFYNTGKLPVEAFNSAAPAFASAISLVYLLLLTRKYREPPKHEVDE
jgi:hypothetical protein